MKKLALILAIAFIAALAAPAMASDFMAGGQARYEAVHINYNDLEDSDGDIEDEDYFDQRYRVAFTWKVNDNVTTQLRADFAEARWGSRDYAWPGKGYRYDAGADTIMVDRAWVKINQGPLTLTVGQQAGSLGHGMIWSDQFQGVIANLDFMPFYVNLLYAKESEGTASEDDDVDIYGGQIGFANDSFDLSFTYAHWNNDDWDGSGSQDLTGYGFDLTVPLAMFTFKGGLAMFDGEEDSDSDFVGTQAFVDFDAAVSDAFKLGLTLIWADEDDTDETQVTSLQDDLGWNYTDFGGVLGYNNGLIKGTAIFDPSSIVDSDSANGEGVVGGILRASFAPADNLTFYGKLGYAEMYGNDGSFNDLMFANASIDWVWMPAVTVSAGVFHVIFDDDNDDDDGDKTLGQLQLTVAF